ncbi:hypothetical protein [Nitratiruptor tergarcus]|uniref:Glycosyltransferase RgtA/B/C/D-like domain-containing protein n=1 Tax=Nitratiruptor tergarcus DSM 16512 TaxID=1069081 RepID=A0A1W1WQH8_9BACT|nr:hypothetical protein [Nitratiruptor tergarcus]SMC08561.1 hypothetical protein SAMN05660197_0317 [Nitratiruptor tergarcus DSM 16512]
MQLRYFGKITWALLFSLLCGIFYYLSTPHIQKSLLNQQKAILLPYVTNAKSKQKFIFDISFFSLNPLQKIDIIPDDCVENFTINKKSIFIKNIEGKCDWKRGFSLDITKYIHPGINHIQLVIKNRNGKSGLYLHFHSPISTVFHLLFSLSLLLLLFLVSNRFFSKKLSFFIVAGIALCMIYLSYTPYYVRTYDVITHTGHLDYIKMIADHFTFPNPTKGWEYHQPPLYYILAAIVYKISLLLYINPYISLQWLSLLFFTIFIIFSIRSLQLVIKKEFLLSLSSLLLIFWPSGIIHSIRIGNDVLTYALTAIGFYYTLLWWQHKRDIKPALLFSALALITKASGIILFIIIGVLIIIEALKQKNKKYFIKMAALAFLFFLVGFVINFADNIYYALQSTSSDWLVSNVVNTLNKKLYVANTLGNYFYFDMKKYLLFPYIDAWHDLYGRQYFWNYFLKSALFAEFFFNDAYHQNIAYILSFLSLILYVSILIGVFTIYKEELQEAAPFLLFFILYILILLAYRIKIPVACNTDFRYVYPLLIPMVYFYAKLYEKLRSTPFILLQYSVVLEAILFSFLSFLFFIKPA